MKTVFIFLVVLILSGCQKTLSRLAGNPEQEINPNPPAVGYQVTTLSCCKSAGLYPVSMPFDFQMLCDNVTKANQGNYLYDNKHYIAMPVDCGVGHHTMGDEYY